MILLPIFAIMPVITRSKARSMTNVSVEGVKLCYCSSVPDHHRIPRPVHTSTDVLSNTSLLPSNISDNIGSSVHELLMESSSHVQVSHVSSSSSIFSEFQNLEISNIKPSPTGTSHNFSSGNFLNMEADCLENSSYNTVEPEVNDNSEIAWLFASLSTQITLQHRDIQEPLQTRDCNLQYELLKVNKEFQRLLVK